MKIKSNNLFTIFIIFLTVLLLFFDLLAILIFNNKIKLGVNSESSQNITKKQYNKKHINNPNIYILSGNGEKIGNIVKIGTEEFYVIGYTKNKIYLLAKYNLDVSVETINKEIIISSFSTYLQSQSATGAYSYRVKKVNTVPYSYDGVEYNKSIVKKIVDKYSQIIKENYNVVNQGRLITLDELYNLGMKDYEYNKDTKYQWLISSSYWTQSSAGSGNIWNVYKDSGMLFYDRFSNDEFYGVRPVIEISKNYIE